MLKKTMTYTDYDGNSRTETFYFNLTRAEVARMELSTSGGMSEMIDRIIEAQDRPSLITVFEELIQKSYGVKTPDGRGFTKKKEDLDNFMSTEAYSDLYMELVTDAKKAAEFFNGIMPKDVDKKSGNQVVPINNN